MAYRDDQSVQIEKLRAENASLRAQRFTALDWIAVVLVATCTAGVAGIAAMGGAFRAMYNDFGAPLPLSTRIATMPWVPPLVALVPGALLASALARKRVSLPARRRLLVVAFVIGLLAIGALVWALYAPIFALAGRIRAE